MADATALGKEFMILASQLGARLFRQNVGLAWIGKARRISANGTARVRAGDVIVSGARPFRSGHAGMSDLGGWTPVTITSDMVGETLAVYTQAEIKTTDRPSEDQLRWIANVQRFGGIAGIVRTDDDLRELLTTKSRSKE